MGNEKNGIDIVKDIMIINPTSKIGKLIKAEKYIDFVSLIENEDNIADAIIEANKVIAIKLQVGIDAKNIIDTIAKPMKKAVAQFRTHLVQYMDENDFDKLEGETKNITFQKEKTTKGVLAIPQIKVGSKYVDIKDLTKEDLIAQLEKLGAKTRVRNENTIAVKPAGITVAK